MLKSLTKPNFITISANSLSNVFGYFFKNILINLNLNILTNIIFTDNASKSSLHPTVNSVIENELFDNTPVESVQAINEKFLKSNSSNYLCIIEAAKVIYELNPSVNQKKALEMVTSLDDKKYGDSLSLEAVRDVFGLINKGFFGKLEAQVLGELKKNVAKMFTHATFLKGDEIRSSDLEKCVKGLSLTANGTIETELIDKMGKTTLKD